MNRKKIEIKYISNKTRQCCSILSTWQIITSGTNRFGSIMVSMLASSVVGRGFEPKTMKLVFVASPLRTQH